MQKCRTKNLFLKLLKISSCKLSEINLENFTALQSKKHIKFVI